MAGRKGGFRHNQDTRDKIQASSLINRLMDHIESEEPKLDASQVNAAKALLNKVLPDLKAVEHSGELTHDVSDPIKELMAAVNGKSRSK